MGWVYEISNQAFVFDQTHWTSACGNTLGALNVKRTEWQTIQAWYPWAQTPEFVAPNSPSSPMPFTDVVFVPSSGPAPVANQVFDLGYQDGELASGEARAFLMRDTDGDGVPDRVLDQGRPPKGVSPPQVTLTGAQVQDRLCVIDINDRAQNPETPRHQFGCEHIEAGDNQLAMRRDIAWAPYIEINPIAPTQIRHLCHAGCRGCRAACPPLSRARRHAN